MPVVNLTPHAVTVAGHTFAPSGSVARCTEESVSAGTWEGIPFARVSYGYPEGLPPETSGTLYIVSAMVRSAVPTRRDLASPGRLVRANVAADGFVQAENITRNLPENLLWSAVSADALGQRLIAAASNGRLYIADTRVSNWQWQAVETARD